MKQSASSKNLSENRRKFRKKYKVYLSEWERRRQYCLRNQRIVCKAVQVAKPLGELIFKKMEATLKNLFTIFNPHQGLSNHSIFKPNLIWWDDIFKKLIMQTTHFLQHNSAFTNSGWVFSGKFKSTFQQPSPAWYRYTSVSNLL